MHFCHSPLSTRQQLLACFADVLAILSMFDICNVAVLQPLQTYKLWSKSRGFVRNLLGAVDLELQWSFRPRYIP